MQVAYYMDVIVPFYDQKDELQTKKYLKKLMRKRKIVQAKCTIIIFIFYYYSRGGKKGFGKTNYSSMLELGTVAS